MNIEFMEDEKEGIFIEGKDFYRMVVHNNYVLIIESKPRNLWKRFCFAYGLFRITK